MSNAWLLAELLISTVARAFYNDTYVILLDALVHEKYIIEEELGPRLKLSAKEVRKITTQLENEMLIKVESVSIDDNKSFIKCYYIDYQLFVDSVRYRIHLMQKAIIAEENSELSQVFYQCPTCKDKYSSLEAQRLLSGDFKFICSNCCPLENFRTAKSESYYRLVEVDNTGKLSKLQLLEKKMEEQMNKSKYHEGIFDLLYKLRDEPLSHNLPSENITRGVRTSKVTDDRVVHEIKQNFEYATGQFGSSLIKKKNNQDVLDLANKTTMERTEFKIHIESEDNVVDEQKAVSNNNNGSNTTRYASSSTARIGSSVLSQKQQQVPLSSNHEASLPHFLQDSRVAGAVTMLKTVENMQQERRNSSSSVSSYPQASSSSGINGGRTLEEDVDNHPNKRAKLPMAAAVSIKEEPNVSVKVENLSVAVGNNITISMEEEQDNDAVEDVAWEDEEEEEVEENNEES